MKRAEAAYIRRRTEEEPFFALLNYTLLHYDYMQFKVTDDAKRKRNRG